MIESAMVYAGLILAVAGAASIVRGSRVAGAIILATGAAMAAAAFALPAGDTRVASPATELDRFVPVFQFHERHALVVRAPRERVYAAIKTVTAREIRLFRALTWIRRMGRPGPEGILNAPADMPILDVATHTTFLTLADLPNREVVVGTVLFAPRGRRPPKNPVPEDFRSLRGPGFAVAAMNFTIEERAGGECLLATETRVFATDASARRRFAPYWRVIYPGSALIRRMWLRAIQQRAQRGKILQ